MSTTPIKPFGPPLTPDEEARLVECEKVITTGLQNFVEVGTALAEVNEKRLYRKTHSDFDSWVRDTYKMTARHAYRLCDAASAVKELVADLPESATHVSQTLNARQATALAKAPKGTRAAVLKEATRTAPGGRVTAKHIAETVSPKQEAIEVEKPHITIDDQWKTALGKKEIPALEPDQPKLTPLQNMMVDLDYVLDQAVETLSAPDLAKFKLHVEVSLRKLRPL